MPDIRPAFAAPKALLTNEICRQLAAYLSNKCMVYNRMAKFRLNIIGLINAYTSNPVAFWALALLVMAIIQAIYVFLTPFERTIKIQEKFEYSSGKYMTNTISDTEGRVYQVTQSWPLLHFRAPEVWMRIEKNKTYVVRGNGIRVPLIGWYPNIVSVVKTIE
jgi:hypothetical protein